MKKHSWTICYYIIRLYLNQVFCTGISFTVHDEKRTKTDTGAFCLICCGKFNASRQRFTSNAHNLGFLLW